MDKLRASEDFIKLIDGFLSKDVYQNAKRLVRDYKAIISEDRLFYLKGEGYRLFIEDRSNFYNVFYFIKKGLEGLSEVEIPNDKKSIIDYVYRDLDQEETAIIETLGYETYIERTSLSLGLDRVGGGGEYSFASHKDLETIFSLQEDHIDPYTGNALSKDELAEEIKNEKLLAVYEGDLLAGFIRFQIRGRDLELDNIVVADTFRGGGRAGQLIEGLIRLGRERDYNKINLWVRDGNIPAMGLYEKFNFKPTGYKCINYIRRGV
ncbi:MAG: GNAT family N-acetyltransferase [Tissierellia bacterium]|nr:GNAT family N-acetyltransferase [Tissierellia bacterium]